MREERRFPRRLIRHQSRMSCFGEFLVLTAWLRTIHMAGDPGVPHPSKQDKYTASSRSTTRLPCTDGGGRRVSLPRPQERGVSHIFGQRYSMYKALRAGEHKLAVPAQHAFQKCATCCPPLPGHPVQAGRVRQSALLCHGQRRWQRLLGHCAGWRGSGALGRTHRERDRRRIVRLRQNQLGPSPLGGASVQENRVTAGRCLISRARPPGRFPGRGQARR